MRCKLKYFPVSEHKRTAYGYEIYQYTVGGKKKVTYIHRTNIENHIGRKLESSEQVHHIDFNKRNNDLSNLFLCRDAEEHRTIHHTLNPLVSKLLERGILRFNRKEKKNELCEK